MEFNGKAWYINPDNSNRYFLGRQSDVFKVMRNLGLGINNNNLEKIKISNNSKSVSIEKYYSIIKVIDSDIIIVDID